MKKAQIKMGETLAVLVIFFFLVVFGLTFYTKMQTLSIKRISEKENSLKAVQVAQRISFMSEFQCSFNNVQKDNCFDLLKVDAFNSAFLSNSDDYLLYYYDWFEYSNISIKKIYPDEGEIYLIYENVPNKYKKELSTKVPISLYDPREDRYYLGMMDVIFYAD